jgi:hypothetical protein
LTRFFLAFESVYKYITDLNRLVAETDFHIFVRGCVDKYLGGVLLLALAGAWWQCLERPRKKFNKICFLGLHGEI